MRSLPRQGSIPARLVRAIGPVAQDAFHRIDARHRCRTGLARARCSLLLARPTPVHPRRSAPAVTQRGRPVLPVADRRRSRWEDVSHRLLQPILSTRTRGPAGLPALSAPRGASSARVEIRLTPSLQLPPRIDALLPEGERRIRTGAAPRPASSPDHRALHATSAAPCHPDPRPCEQLSRPRTASASPSSKGAASATRSGFVGSLPLSISFRRPRGGSSRPLQSPRLPSTKPRTSRFPARPAGGLPPAQRIRAAARLSTCSRPRRPDPGAGGGLSARQLLPDDPVAGKLLPAPARRGHLLSRARIPLRLEQPDKDVEPACDGRSRALRVRAASPTPPRRGTRSAYPRCLPSRSSRREVQALHRLSPTCGFLIRCLYYHRDLVRKDMLTMS